jgi:histidinol-phosphate aminotransferase
MNFDPMKGHVPIINSFHGGKFFQAIGEDFSALERSAGVISADVLDAWFDPSPRVISKLTSYLPFLLRTSPPVYACGLVEAIAGARGVPKASILAGGGSSDLIFTCLPHLIGRGQRAIVLDPMYCEYSHIFEKVIGAELTRFPLYEEAQFRIDTDRLRSFAKKEQPALVAIVNPNSPTGQHWPREELIGFIDSVSANTWVVVDETYVEYVGGNQSIEGEASRRENVIVLKSMSKVYALSGLRVGYMVANPSVIEKLAPWMPPWAVSLPAQAAAVEALADTDYYQERYRETHKLREAFACELRRIGRVTVYPSCANFSLVGVPERAQSIVEHMRTSNVFVRNCDSMSERFDDRFLRIAVKSAAENQAIAAALRGALCR